MDEITNFVANAGGQILAYLPAPGTKIGKIRVYSVPDALQQQTANSYFVKGIIAPREMSVWYGQPGSGKSFEMLYISYAIAQGKAVLDKRVQQAPVLYLALEATTGITKRIRALVQDQGICADFHYIAEPINFSDDAMNANLIAAIEHFGVKVLVIDTMARALQGGDENSSQHMGAFINAVDEIKNKTGCHVAIVHHSGKNDSAGMRGHSSLLGATDVAVEINGKTGETHTAKIVKNKEDVSGTVFGFNLNVVELGLDEDGDPVTTCLVEETEAPAKKSDNEKLTPMQKGYLQDIENLMAGDATNVQTVTPHAGMRPQKCITREQLRHHLAKVGRFTVPIGEPLANKDRAALKRNLEALRDKDRIGISEDYIWLV